MNHLPPSISQLLAGHTQLTNALAQTTAASMQQENVLFLLQADLRYYRLLYGLQQAGLLVEHFYGNLLPVVLPMLGFGKEQVQEDSVVEFYFGQLDKYMELPLKDFSQDLPQLAMEMYGNLVVFRTELGV